MIHGQNKTNLGTNKKTQDNTQKEDKSIKDQNKN